METTRHFPVRPHLVKRVAAGFAVIFALSGCVVGPDYG